MADKKKQAMSMTYHLILVFGFLLCLKIGVITNYVYFYNPANSVYYYYTLYSIQGPFSRLDAMYCTYFRGKRLVLQDCTWANKIFPQKNNNKSSHINKTYVNISKTIK